MTVLLAALFLGISICLLGWCIHEAADRVEKYAARAREEAEMDKLMEAERQERLIRGMRDLHDALRDPRR